MDSRGYRAPSQNRTAVINKPVSAAPGTQKDFQNIGGGNTVAVDRDRIDPSRRRVGTQPIVLNRIKETPIWQSHLASTEGKMSLVSIDEQAVEPSQNDNQMLISTNEKKNSLIDKKRGPFLTVENKRASFITTEKKQYSLPIAEKRDSFPTAEKRDSFPTAEKKRDYLTTEKTRNYFPTTEKKRDSILATDKKRGSVLSTDETRESIISTTEQKRDFLVSADKGRGSPLFTNEIRGSTVSKHEIKPSDVPDAKQKSTIVTNEDVHSNEFPAASLTNNAFIKNDRRPSLPPVSRIDIRLQNQQTPSRRPHIGLTRHGSIDNSFAPSFQFLQRAPVFASILVIGLTKAGKSSTINSILKQKVASVSERNPSREIIEYTAQVKIPDSSEFYNLQIIDTPGFTNVRDSDHDASFLTTLLSYLESRDGLRGKPPSLALVVTRFDDNKFMEGERSELVNFLKVINHYQRQFNNSKFPNFIFALTHFKQAKKEDQTNPFMRCQKLLNLIENYTSLPQPLPLVCAENQGLSKNNDFVEMPNEEHFPNSLIERMKSLLTRKGRDSITETIIRTAFGVDYPNSIQITGTRKIPLLQADHPTVQNTKKILRQIYSNIERTEISFLLEVGWENVDLKLRKSYPSSLHTLQSSLQMKEIKNFSNLPDDPLQVLNLIKEMPQNLAVSDLLIQTLQLNIPDCPIVQFIGQGYDVSNDKCTGISPFDFSKESKTSPVGRIPIEIDCNLKNDRMIVFKFFYSFEEYVLERLKDLSMRHAIFPAVNTTTNSSTTKRVGYNIIKSNEEVTKNTTATALIEYQLFRLTLQDHEGMEVKSLFWDAATSIPGLDEKSPENILKWRDFFSFWGTHIIKSACGGGSIEVKFKGTMLETLYDTLTRPHIFAPEEEETSRVFQWITGDGLEFVVNRESRTDFLQGMEVNTGLLGGFEKFQQCDLTKIPHDKVTEIREEWKESLLLKPVLLETNLVLIPLSFYVRERCQDTATKMDIAFHYIYSNFIAGEGKNSSCNIL